MITKQQIRSIQILARGHGAALTEAELFSLTSREAARIIARLER